MNTIIFLILLLRLHHYYVGKPSSKPKWRTLGFTFLITIQLCLFWRRQWHPTPELLPGKSYGWRSLVGCSPWGREESDTTKQLPFHFSLSCIGEGNGNPLQCSCLENPRDRGTWRAAVYGVTQSRTRLKRLSSSSSSSHSQGSAPTSCCSKFSPIFHSGEKN